MKVLDKVLGLAALVLSLVCYVSGDIQQATFWMTAFLVAALVLGRRA